MQNHIAHYRKQKRLSQRDLALLLGVAVPRISEWENNKFEPLTSTSLRIAAILDCRVEDLFSLDATDKPPTNIRNY
jgi:putative transcriptional regulator